MARSSSNCTLWPSGASTTRRTLWLPANVAEMRLPRSCPPKVGAVYSTNPFDDVPLK